jgi:hypothetical protein
MVSKTLEQSLFVVGMLSMSAVLIIMGYLLMPQSVFVGVTSAGLGGWFLCIILNAVFKSIKSKQNV